MFYYKILPAHLNEHKSFSDFHDTIYLRSLLLDIMCHQRNNHPEKIHQIEPWFFLKKMIFFKKEIGQHAACKNVKRPNRSKKAINKL